MELGEVPEIPECREEFVSQGAVLLRMDNIVPPMSRVIEVAIKFLDCDAYLPQHIGRRAKSVRDRKKKKRSVESDEESSDDDSSSLSSSSQEEGSSSSDEDEPEVKKRLKGKRGSSRDDIPRESKNEEKPPTSDPNMHSNIDDLAEWFRRLELQLGERGNRDAQVQTQRATVYCFMCGKPGHVVRDCEDSRFFLTQGICRLDINNRVVMSDGSALPRAEGDGGATKVIFRRMIANMSSSGPTATSTSIIEVVAGEAYYNSEIEELALLGQMEFEVLPAERGDKPKKAKPYDRQESKKVAERTVPEVPR